MNSEEDRGCAKHDIKKIVKKNQLLHVEKGNTGRCNCYCCHFVIGVVDATKTTKDVRVLDIICVERNLFIIKQHFVPII